MPYEEPNITEMEGTPKTEIQRNFNPQATGSVKTLTNTFNFNTIEFNKLNGTNT